MPIRPILLKGHSRPLTCVKFNRDADLLFTCAKDNSPNVWFAENGERLGTFRGHSGAVFDCDIDYFSHKLLTSSADRTVKLWKIKTGEELFSWQFKSGVRSVSFAQGERMFMAVTDQTFSSQPTIFIYNLAEFAAEDEAEEEGEEGETASSSSSSSRRGGSKRANALQEQQPVREMFVDGLMVRSCGALWGPLNSSVIAAYDDGSLRLWDVENGVCVTKVSEHKKAINSLAYSPDKSMIITASSDQTCKIFDASTLTLLKTFSSDRPLNSAAISPINNHVIVGGGQDAMNVTTTSSKVGHFEVDFYHTVYGDFLGSVKGHFGPVNSVAFNTNGKSFASGAEDGYVRLHNFDAAYFNLHAF